MNPDELNKLIKEITGEDLVDMLDQDWENEIDELSDNDKCGVNLNVEKWMG